LHFLRRFVKGEAELHLLICTAAIGISTVLCESAFKNSTLKLGQMADACIYFGK
jgi:hypothetical protein